jgi:malate dehydrogenase (oxaloacetate-decarboxylating)(NADP+)
VTLAALEAALREQKKALKDITVLFYGAGEAGVGIGELVVRAL